MLLTNDEMTKVRQMIEAQAGLDEELMQRCGHLIRLGAFDEAVRSAFVLLEERLRKAAGQDGMTGTRLANYAFKEDGPLAKRLSHKVGEQQGLRELYSGAFRLFRNPTAHGIVNYSPEEGKAIIGLVDLLLGMIKRAEEIPAEGAFPENVERLLSEFESLLGPAANGWLRTFLGKCAQAGIRPSNKPKYEIPFRRSAFIQRSWWDKPKRHITAVFYVGHYAKQPCIYVPVADYLDGIVGLDIDQLAEMATAYGLTPQGKYRNPIAVLADHKEEAFFDGLWKLVTWLDEAFDSSLEQRA